MAGRVMRSVTRTDRPGLPRTRLRGRGQLEFD